MFKHSFKNDYSEGAHSKVMDFLVKANGDVYDGYGYDKMTKKTADLLRSKIGNENVDINFFAGGTQTNFIGINSFLRPHHGIISTTIGHINTHECGAVESTGHKILTVETKDGKLKPLNILKILEEYTDEHLVCPKLVYISNSTENGLVYTKEEITQISNVCRENNLYLFLDGARLGSALNSLDGDLTLNDISNLVDAFYIGGTKNGMLFGEAFVMCNEKIKKYVRYNMKRSGAILAKTWVVAAQFYALFEDDLYFQLADNANKCAKKLYDGLSSLGFSFLVPFSSNQIFPILSDDLIEKIKDDYDFTIWEKSDDNTTVIRLVTSWATTIEKVTMFLDDIKKLV